MVKLHKRSMLEQSDKYACNDITVSNSITVKVHVTRSRLDSLSNMNILFSIRRNAIFSPNLLQKSNSITVNSRGTIGLKRPYLRSNRTRS